MKISVLGFTYKVVRGYIPVAGVGTTDHIKQIITLDPALDYEHTVETLLHEVLHCVEFAMGLDLKEPEVHNLSRGLYSVLTDPQNDAFWAALAGSDEIMEEEDEDVALDPGEILEVWGNGDPYPITYDNGDDLEAPSTYITTRTDRS